MSGGAARWTEGFTPVEIEAFLAVAKRTFAPFQIGEMVRMWRRGETLEEIGEAFNVTAQRVSNQFTSLRREGVDLSSRPPRSGCRDNTSDNWADGLTAAEIEAVEYLATRNWAAARLADVIRLYRAGVTLHEMERTLKCAEGVAGNKLSQLRAYGVDLARRRPVYESRTPRPRPRFRAANAGAVAMRKCLNCDQMFKSSGPGNRLCGWCPKSDASGMDDCSLVGAGRAA